MKPKIKFVKKVPVKTGSRQVKPVVRVFATISLAHAVGAKIFEIEMAKGDLGNSKLIANSITLRSIGYSTSKKYPSKSIKANNIIDVGNAVSDLLNGSLKPVVVLVMVLAGLNDLEIKCSHYNKCLFPPIIKAVRDCIDCYLLNEDDEPEGSEDAFERYNNWVLALGFNK